MQLTANIERESISLRASDGHADAGTTSDGRMAAVEVAITGELRVSERDDARTNVLSLDFEGGREHMRRVALLMLEKSGSPAFTASEWLDIAIALERHAHHAPHSTSTRLEDYARQIREAYER